MDERSLREAIHSIQQNTGQGPVTRNEYSQHGVKERSKTKEVLEKSTAGVRVAEGGKDGEKAAKRVSNNGSSLWREDKPVRPLDRLEQR